MEFKRFDETSGYINPEKYQIPVSGVQTQPDTRAGRSPEIPDSSKWSSNKMYLYLVVVQARPEIPDSSKWSSNYLEKVSSVEQVGPEIPDSSKWSSNLKIILVQAASGKPEIPDSSKWSSNIHVLKGRFSYDVA